ncbi:hypothetical protein [uncultured Shimia sp.]|uniref:hypothetical protein n=1 Tax=uncultured Shimia sp. TaxID=573152 RepID=UPI0026267866|nr:hypothetical protein [uncultured Shimia sp.]
MSEISDLESRISAAMDRISRGLEGLTAPAGEDDAADAAAKSELSDAQAALENEKLANTQLEERIKTLNTKLEDSEAELATARQAVEAAAEAREAAEESLREAKAEVEAKEAAAADAAPEVVAIDLETQRDTIGELASRLRRLRRTSRMVRAAIQQLRAAAESGLKDPSLINQALVAELDDLKSMRAAELAEMDVIVTALRPLLGTEAPANTDSGEDA